MVTASFRRARGLLMLALITGLITGLVAGCGSDGASGKDLDSVPDYVQINGKPLPAPAGGVTQSDGSQWTYRGVPDDQITLLYFGYTSCPDVCPTTMADVANALGKISPAVRQHISVQFVSTDPHRDTSDQIKSWLGGFDPSFRGGRAPIDKVIKQALAYGINIDPPKITDGNYEVTHGAQLLVLAPGGGSVGYFRGLAGWKSYVAALPTLVDRYA